MAYDVGLLDLVRDAMAPVGDVTVRGMMGGATLYLDGTVFAILSGDGLWFKADARTDERWDAAGCARFSYARKDGTTGTMNYRRAPADAYDDPDELRRWAALALDAGLRGAAGKRRRT